MLDPPESSSPEEQDIEGSEEVGLNPKLTDRVLIEKADRSFSELYRWHNSGRIILDPE